MSSFNITEIEQNLGAYCRDHAPKWIADLIFGTTVSSVFTPMSGFIDQKILLDVVLEDSIVKPYNKNFSPSQGNNFKPRILDLTSSKLEFELEPMKYRELYLGNGLKPKADSFDVPYESWLMKKIRTRAQQNVEKALVKGVYDPLGTNYLDICDGILTIINQEIGNNNLTEANGKMIDLGAGPITETNAYDRIESFFELAVHPEHWESPDFVLLCAPEVKSHYNKAFQTKFGATPFNTEYGRQYLLAGTGKNIELKSLPGMAGSQRLILAPNWNLFLGLNSGNGTMSVQRFNWVINIIAAFRLGVQIGSLEFVWINKIHETEPEQEPETEPNQ